MIFFALIYLSCWMWGIGTDFAEHTRCTFALFSIFETIVEIALFITWLNWRNEK